MAAIGGLIGAALLAVGIGGYALTRPPGSADDASAEIAAQAAADSTLVVDWSPEDRHDAKLLVDGKKIEFTEAEAIEVRLPSGQHNVQIMRRGFQPVEEQVTTNPGDPTIFSPSFTLMQVAGVTGDEEPDESLDTATGFSAASIGSRLSGRKSYGDFTDWLQDFETAQRTAADEKKDILLLFTGSDWSADAQRLAREILFRPEFRDAADEKFVLTVIDLPRTRSAAQRVENMERNFRLAKDFDIDAVPVLYITDELGLPYATEGFIRGGVTETLKLMDHWADSKAKRDAKFGRIYELQGTDSLRAAEEALEWVKDADLVEYYQSPIQRWLDLAVREDPKNEHGLQEVFFEMVWLLNCASAGERDLNALPGKIDLLTRWKKTCDFKDANRAGRVHFIAATWLAALDMSEEATRYAVAGLNYGPDDEDLAAQLKQATQSLTVLGSGTGFVVGDDGYLLTNRHVVEGPGHLAVRVPGQDEPVKAKLIAQHSQGDMALIKIELPAKVQLARLPITADAARRGQDVAAFGYPLGDQVGSGIKLTKGSVSSTPDPSADDMLLLDLTINPGNSGGPLVSAKGEVIGMVTAKSRSSSDVDSYGMAIPSEDLISFLTEHLPNFSGAVDGSADRASMNWEEVDSRVSPSVLMILKMR